ncbi:MAG: GYD domain-containing protein [Betaproteobacteria bacterium]|nr:GYD domain-containing protein [Betaproteobacteria bacterium]
MAKYLWQASYTASGFKGLIKAGGNKRRKAVEAALQTVGGKLEAFYFALGKVDVFIIADVPDNVSIAAASLVINAAGAVTVNTTALLTPDEMDQAAKQYKHLRYQPPR